MELFVRYHVFKIVIVGVNAIHSATKLALKQSYIEVFIACRHFYHYVS